jgi:hypothetical protein
MSSSKLKRSGRAPSEVANSGLMETGGHKLFRKPLAKDPVSPPDSGSALQTEEMNLSNNPVRSPERAKNAFFENDYLNGE